MRVGDGWEVFEVNPGRVRSLIVGCHYLHRMPAVTPCALALMVDGWIRGALLWSIPPRESGPGCWELSRLWCAEELPKNSESWFIAQAVQHVRRTHQSVRRLVSYADPAAGHSGTIYRAANWHYDGLTDSERKTPRFDYWANGRRLGRASHGTGLLVEKRRRTPKHRFTYSVPSYGHG